jgi:hypothetical protein
VLLDNELWADSPYRPILKRLSSDLGVPLVDSYAMIDAARQHIEQDLETRFALTSAGTGPVAPAAGEKTTVVFRAYRGTVGVPKALSIVGVDPQLGALQPNRILMHDDGLGGDEHAGDGVWSYSATLPAGSRVAYVYTNSGAEGRWESLDVPHIRSIKVPAAPLASRRICPSTRSAALMAGRRLAH